MKKIAISFIFLAVMAAASFAQVFDFTLVNKTGHTIAEVYCSPAEDEEWGDDVLGEDVLKNGASVDIQFPAAYEKILLAFEVDLYDLKVKYLDYDVEQSWTNLKLEEIVTITLTLDKQGKGIATFE